MYHAGQSFRNCRGPKNHIAIDTTYSSCHWHANAITTLVLDEQVCDMLDLVNCSYRSQSLSSPSPFAESSNGAIIACTHLLLEQSNTLSKHTPELPTLLKEMLQKVLQIKVTEHFGQLLNKYELSSFLYVWVYACIQNAGGPVDLITAERLVLLSGGSLGKVLRPQSLC